MQFKDVELEARREVDEVLRSRAKAIVAERHRELVVARKTLVRMEKEYAELLEADVEELLRDVPQGASICFERKR